MRSSYTIRDDDFINKLALVVNIKNEPNTYKQAIASPQCDSWKKSMQRETDELEAQDT